MARIITRAIDPTLSTYAMPRGVRCGEYREMLWYSRDIVAWPVRAKGRKWWVHMPYRPMLEDTTDWGFEKWKEKQDERSWAA